MIYEFFLLLAVLFISSAFFHLFADPNTSYFRSIHQFYLLFVMGTYFIWFWTHAGQTLAMQTWKMRVVTLEGNRLNTKQAITRYLVAVIGVFFFGVGILWALFDRDRQFLHDRVAGTQIVSVEK